MSWPYWAMVGLWLVFVGGYAYYYYRMYTRRVPALRRVAEELGVTFYPDPSNAWVPPLRTLCLFAEPLVPIRPGKVENLMRGELCRTGVAIFDHEGCILVDTGDGLVRRRSPLTVVCLSLKGATFPTFSLQPKIKWWAGSPYYFDPIDVDVQRLPLLSEKFILHVPKATTVHSLGTNAAAVFYGARESLSTEGAGEWLVFYRFGKYLEPAKFGAALDEAFEALALFQKIGV